MATDSFSGLFAIIPFMFGCIMVLHLVRQHRLAAESRRLSTASGSCRTDVILFGKHHYVRHHKNKHGTRTDHYYSAHALWHIPNNGKTYRYFQANYDLGDNHTIFDSIQEGQVRENDLAYDPLKPEKFAIVSVSLATDLCCTTILYLFAILLLYGCGVLVWFAEKSIILLPISFIVSTVIAVAIFRKCSIPTSSRVVVTEVEAGTPLMIPSTLPPFKLLPNQSMYQGNANENTTIQSPHEASAMAPTTQMVPVVVVPTHG